MATTSSPPKHIIKVRVKRLSSRGILVITEEGLEGLLPATEWSYEGSDWETARRTLKHGDVLDVVQWSRSLQHGQPAFSRRRVKFDPWNSVTNAWLGQFKSFAVSRLTRRHAIGEIEPGLQGKIDVEDLRRYVEARDARGLWKSHVAISLGDTLGGTVVAIHAPSTKAAEPEIILSISKFLEQMEKSPDLLAGQKPGAHTHQGHSAVQAPPKFAFLESIEHIFLVDDDLAFVDGVIVLLREAGYDLTVATSEQEALEKLALLDVDSISMALIDLHLSSALPIHNGLHVAAQVLGRNPRCKIVFITGEYFETLAQPQLMDKVRESAHIPITGYLAKPFTFEQLQTEISAAAVAKPKVLGDFLKTHLDRDYSVLSDRLETATASPWRFTLFDAVKDLAEKLEGVVVHVFEMQPINSQGWSLAHSGEGLNLDLVRHKLGKSPVRDTAVAGRREVWIDSDVERSQQLLGRHFWLRKAMSYRSALGVPIYATSPMGYCLLAFHSRPNVFDPDFVSEARLCAERCARALEWKWLMQQTEQRSRFESAGMAFACLGHELRNLLIGMDADAFRLGRLASVALSGSEKDLLKLAVRMRNTTLRAIKIAQNFGGIQLPASDEVFDVLECLGEAIRAARVQAPSDRVEIREILGTHNGTSILAKGDRASVLIAFFNLLLNAIQQISLFVRPRGVVWLDWQIYSGTTRFIQIEFHDSGPGIHRGDFEKVFEVGYSTKPEGTGMGLHICRQVLKGVRDGNARGEVRVSRSILNVGTTFSVRLPILDRVANAGSLR